LNPKQPIFMNVPPITSAAGEVIVGGRLRHWRISSSTIILTSAILGWWGWLWWFAGQCRELNNWYSWVYEQPKRDGFSITFGLLTLLSAVVLAWAWYSNLPVRKRLAASCFVIVGGIILPVLAGAFSLIVSMGYPKGWHQDMARAVLLTVTPILSLLAGMAVLWLHRSRPRLLFHYLSSAYAAGWLVIPVVLSGSIKTGLRHFTHPHFEGVVLTLLSLVILLTASWTMRNQRHKLWVFFVAGLIAGPGALLIRTTPRVENPAIVSYLTPISTTSPLIALADRIENGHRTLTFSPDQLRGLPDMNFHAQSIVVHRITERLPKADTTYDLPQPKPYLKMGWEHPSEATAQQKWQFVMELSDNGGPRYQGQLTLEGECYGLGRRPLVSLPAGKTSQLRMPGSILQATLKPPRHFIKHGATCWTLERIEWSPHGAWARESWRPGADDDIARLDWIPTFSPAPPYPFSISSHYNHGQFRSVYRQGTISFVMRWQLFEEKEYRLLSQTERKSHRAERQAAWERWLETATMTLHEPADQTVIPFRIDLVVPVFQPAP
jgi:hypothetical protein